MSDTCLLLVEDDPINRKLFLALLEVKGYNTITAENGAQALKLASEKHPACVLMDVQLPDMSGLDVARQLKAAPATSDIPILALTAFAMPGDKKRCLEAGCCGYISKPINTATFYQSIEDAIQKSSKP